jgi:hypothetical protein
MSQWTLVNGVQQAQSDLIAVHTPSSSLEPASRKDPLWAISVEVEGNAAHGREAAAQVAQTLHNALSTERSLSMTSSLRHALKAAYTTLDRYNHHVPLSQRVHVGATCAIVHGAHLFVAQVQPAQVLVVHATRLRALPTPRAWSKGTDPAMGRRQRELNAQPDAELNWFRFELQAGDVVVLCSTNIVQLLSKEDIEQVLGKGDAATIAQILYERCQAAKLRNAHAVVLKALASPASNGDATVDTATLPKQPATVPTTANRRTLLTRQPQMLRRGVLKAEPYRRASRSFGYPHLPSFWLSGLLIMIVVVALIMVGLQQRRQRDQRRANLALDQVEQAVVAAGSAAKNRMAQQQLAVAETSLRSGIDPLIQNGIITETNLALWARYQQVLKRYDQTRAAINKIGFLDQLQTVATLPAKHSTIGLVVIGSTQAIDDTPPLFYLDHDNGLLYQQGRAEPILQPGTQIGSFNVRPIQEALWHQNDIIALDRGEQDAPDYRAFLRIGNDWRVEQLNQTETLAITNAPVPMATYDGNLYLWDSKAKQVWRYTSGQYSNPPVPWIVDAGKASLDQVVDIAVDGRLYLLNRDGSLLVFQGGQFVKQFPAPELAVPLTTVARFIVTDEVISEDGVTQQHPGFFYILDPSNERVFQIDKEEGRLVQQIQARTRGPLNQLRDVAVDEVRRTLYIANGPHVLQAVLPEPPQRVPGRATATQ